MSKTDLMLLLEHERDEQIEDLLVKMLNQHGPVVTADFLGIGYKTLYRWMARFGIQKQVMYIRGKHGRAQS